jgi:hypothetical protein
MPLFTTPLAFVGLLALPALAAIYLLHNRSRRYPVSSLLLWADAREARDGGTRVDRLRSPLLFWLELLALLLLALAAAGPHLLTAGGARPLVVVIDDSFSMLAGGPDSPREKAASALLEELGRRPRGSVRLVLAGERPQVLGDGRRSADVEPLLAGWACRSPSAALGPAVAFALELGGDLSTVLVLTDHAPPVPVTAGRVRWRAFGTPRPNWAVVNAGRSPGPRGDRLLLEVANLAGEPRSTTLRVAAGEAEAHRSELRLAAGETHRVVLELPADAPAVRAGVGPDDLAVDDAVSLVPAGRKAVGFDLKLGDPAVKSVADRAARSAGAVPSVGVHPGLTFLDGDAPAPDGDETWVVRVLSEPDAEAFTGPFVLDRAHPLSDGLSLAGVVWGGGKSPLPGAPVVMAGNAPLLTDSESPTGRHELRLRLRQDLSTLTESPAWPALVWNLVRWRSANLPGPDRANVRVGEEVTWTLATPAEAVEVTPPDGAAVKLPARGRRATVRADRPGVFRLRAGAEAAEFAANPLSRDESDLTKCEAGHWGDEPDAATLRLEYRDATWALVLLALGVLTLHLWLLTRAP